MLKKFLDFRTCKDKAGYEKEIENQIKRIEKYKADGRDEYDIRKQEEVTSLLLYFAYAVFECYIF